MTDGDVSSASFVCTLTHRALKFDANHAETPDRASHPRAAMPQRAVPAGHVRTVETMALWDQLKTALRGPEPKLPARAPSRRQTMTPEAAFVLKVGFEDMEVIGAFGVFMERLSNSDRAKGDSEGLPFPRERIRTVLLRALSLDPPADQRASLAAALTFLDRFAPGDSQ